MKPYPLYIFDLDGTLFRGEEPTPGAIETVAELRQRGSWIRFLTNNSSVSRQDLALKLKRIGFEAASDEVYGSAMATAAYLRGRVDWVHVVGEAALISALAEVAELHPNFNRTSSEPQPGAVVAGICRSFDYKMLAEAMEILRDPEIAFIATNTDATYPLAAGALVPGAGAIVSALKTCTGREPFVVGKPNPLMIEMILAETGIAPTDCLVVGDRVDTDIEAGKRAGCDCGLVLCGVTEFPPEGGPFAIIEDVRGLLV